MAQQRHRHSRQHWQELIDGWADSGLSQQDYCEIEGVALSSWQRWRRIFREEQFRADPQTGSPDKLRLLPVELTDLESRRETALTLTLAGGQRIEIPPGFDADALQRLLGVLHKAP